MSHQVQAEGRRSRGVTLEVLTREPLCAATPVDALAETLTPTDAFFVRNHFPIPRVDPGQWRLVVGGACANPMSLSLDDLRRHPAREVTTTMECAGNGRWRFDPRPPGVTWNDRAVATAAFAGVPLTVLLAEAGCAPGAVEILARGLDRGVEGGREIAFERSLPVEVAMHPDTLVAYEMNGRPLTPEHGFPARLVVPGWYGVASVKWLAAIEVVREPFEGWFQKDRYVVGATPVSRMLVKSLVATPTEGTTLAAGRDVEVHGFAWCGDGRIDRVEVSTDGGASWHSANLGEAPSPYAWTPFAWTWRAPRAGAWTILARASTDDGRVQPMKVPWNAHGYLHNAVVPVSVRVA